MYFVKSEPLQREFVLHTKELRKIYQNTGFRLPMKFSLSNNLTHPGCLFSEEKTFEACYSDHTCSIGTDNYIAKDKCCCGNPGRAFGNCDKCPLKGEGNYIDKL